MQINVFTRVHRLYEYGTPKKTWVATLLSDKKSALTILRIKREERALLFLFVANTIGFRYARLGPILQYHEFSQLHVPPGFWSRKWIFGYPAPDTSINFLS